MVENFMCLFSPSEDISELILKCYLSSTLRTNPHYILYIEYYLI